MNNAICGKAIAALLLSAGLLASSAARAGLLEFDGQGNAVFGVTHEAPGMYSDEFVFSLEGEEHYYASGSAVTGYSFFNNALSANYLITGVQIFSQNADSSRTYLQTLSSFDGATVFYPFNHLTPGNYGFIISGRTVQADAGGSFAGNFNIAPVPEPATYGMLLGGMAVVAFAARRRKS